MVKTLQLKLRNPPEAFLASASREVNLVWNWVNETSFKAIRKFSGKAEFLSAFDFNHLLSNASPPQFKKKDGTVPKGLVFQKPSKAHEAIGFDYIDTAVAQSVAKEYVIRRNQFRKAKLHWRASRGAKKALGWIPFKADNVSLSLQDVNGDWCRLTGRKVNLHELLLTHDFSHLAGLKKQRKPQFALRILGQNFSSSIPSIWRTTCWCWKPKSSRAVFQRMLWGIGT